MTSSIGNLKGKLEKASLQPNDPGIRKLLPEIDSVSNPDDIGQLIGPLVKLLPSHDVLLKKIVYNILCRYCQSHSDVSYLLANTLLKDCKDPNPMVRKISLSVLCQLPALSEHVSTCLPDGLRDSSPYVRRAAVLSCGSLYEHCPHLVDGSYINILYEMIRDSDPIVVANCLVTLEKILSAENGVVINRPMMMYLLKRLNDFPIIQMCLVFEFMHKYQPSTEDEAVEIINILDPYLNHIDRAITFTCLKLFLHFAEKLPALKSEVFDHLHRQLAMQLATCSAEFLYFAVEFLRSNERLKEFASEYMLFFPKIDDTPAVIRQKLEALSVLCTNKNYTAVICELSRHSRDTNVSDVAIHGLCTVAKEVPESLEQCFGKLVGLLELQKDVLTVQVSQALQTLDLSRIPELRVKSSLDSLFSVWKYEDKCPPTLPWLLGQFGEAITYGPHHMERIVANFENYSYTTKDAILTSTLQLYFKRPPECQDLLGSVLEKCVSDDNIYLKDRACLFYKVLKKDVGLAHAIVYGNWQLQ